MDGMLGGISLMEALKALAVLEKTGVLKVTDGSQGGEVYLKAGKVAGLPDVGETDEAAVEETVVSGLVELLELPGGKYEFSDSNGLAEDLPMFSMEMDMVIDAVTARQEEWRAIRALLPGADSIIELVIDQGDDVVLSKDEWRLLCNIGHRPLLGDLLTTCGTNALGGSRSVVKMIKKGLVRVAEEEHMAEVTDLTGDKDAVGKVLVGKYISGREMGQRLNGEPLTVPQEWSSYYDLLDKQRDLAQAVGD